MCESQLESLSACLSSAQRKNPAGGKALDNSVEWGERQPKDGKGERMDGELVTLGIEKRKEERHWEKRQMKAEIAVGDRR